MHRHITVSLQLLFLLEVTIAFWPVQSTPVSTVSKHTLIHQRKTKEAFVTNFENQKNNTVQKRSKQNAAPDLPIANAMHLLGYSGNNEFDNSTHIRRGNKTCRKISCTINHFVRSCDEDGGNDTCVPCAAGTFLYDNTSSKRHNHECVIVPPCYPEATLSQDPNFCGEHRTFCKCDLTRNFCGHDPCNCRVGHCSSVSAPLLNINCGCDKPPTTTRKIPPTPTREIKTTRTTTTTQMSSVTRSKFTSSTMYTTSMTTRQTTVQPPCNQQNTGYYINDFKRISKGFVAFLCFFAGVGCTLAGICVYKRRQGCNRAPPEDVEERHPMQSASTGV